MPVSDRPGRSVWWLLPILVIAAAAVPLVLGAIDDSGTDGLRYANPADSQVRQPSRQAASQSVDDSRRTALVRAAESVAPSVVSINVLRRQTVRPRSMFEDLFLGPGTREVQGLGSGFVLDARGYVLTNEHVVRGATELVVTLADGRDVEAEIVGTDDVTDLALLRLVDPPPELRAAPIGSSSDLVIGEWVVAIGNPFGYLLSNPEPTVTAGVVSGVGRNIIPGDGSRTYYLDMIQTDASINPGNSGGALVNVLGEVVGVNSSIISETGSNVGLGFAIPIDRARRVADALLSEGRVSRVWLGVELTEAEPNRFGRSHQLFVSNVVPGSPAEQAGLRTGMLIDSAGGRPIRSMLDWEGRLLDLRVGEAISVVASENAQQRTLNIVTQDLPSLTAERVSAGSDFEFVTLTPAIRAERGLNTEEGALLVDMSDAARRQLGLRDGDLVVEINRVRIRSAQDAASILRRLSERRTLVRMVFERRGNYNAVQFYIGG
jgi:serine protease Do